MTPDELDNLINDASGQGLAWYSIVTNTPIVPTASGGAIPAVLPSAVPLLAPAAAAGSPLVGVGGLGNSGVLVLVGLALLVFLLVEHA